MKTLLFPLAFFAIIYCAHAVTATPYTSPYTSPYIYPTSYPGNGTYCHYGWTGNNCDIDIDECLLSPCNQSDVCVNIHGSYICSSNGCANNPCKNGYSCWNTSPPGNFTCFCNKGYWGRVCERDVDECLSSPCAHGTVCINTIGSYICSSKGCAGYHCQNVFSCKDVAPQGNFSCDCNLGWTGKICEQDINECQWNVCLNGGTCQNTLGSFTCSCKPGWEGPSCLLDVNECNFLSPCPSGMSCINTPGSYACVNSCEQFESESKKFPSTYYVRYSNSSCYLYGKRKVHYWDARQICLDLGSDLVAIETPEENTIVAAWGYSIYNDHWITGGKWFEDSYNNWSLRWISTNQTMTYKNFNNGKGTQTYYPFVYIDPTNWGYWGKWGNYQCCPENFICESRTDGARGCDNYCKNGGTCSNSTGYLQCNCSNGWTGHYCEIKVDTCASSPCKNGGTCQDVGGSFNCSCERQWTGPTCQEKANTTCHDYSLDIMFIVDGSGSIGSSSFREALDFVTRMIDRLHIADSRVAVIVYNSYSYLKLSFTYNKEYAKKEIDKISYPSGGTNTGRAINLAVAQFESGNRLNDPNVMSIALVLTDGKSGDSVYSPAQKAKNLGIIVYAIGIGYGIDFDELEDIATVGSRVYKVQDTSFLSTIEGQIHEKVCEDAVGIKIFCTSNPIGFPQMEVFIGKSLQNGPIVTLGSCPFYSLQDGRYIRHTLINDTEQYWYLNITGLTCGTTINYTAEYILFNNHIVLSKSGAPGQHPIITRDFSSRSHWGLRCMYKTKVNVTSEIDVVGAPPVIIGEGQLQIKASIYTTSSYVYESSPPFVFHLKESIYLQYTLLTYYNFEAFLLHCWATPMQNTTTGISYDLIKDGCKKDDTVTIHPTYGIRNKARLSFQVFKFRGLYDQVFLHCQIQICDATDWGSRCHRGCQNQTAIGRRRRAINNHFNRVQEVTMGPFHLAPKEAQQCQEIVKVPNGRVDCTRGFSVSSICTFKCRHGFTLVSPPPFTDTRTCIQSSTYNIALWDGPLPNCTDVNECKLEEKNICQQNLERKKCINNHGSYECVCPDGKKPLPSFPNYCRKSNDLKCSIKIDQTFINEYSDPESPQYKQIQMNLTKEVTEGLDQADPEIESKVELIKLTPGSVVAHFAVSIFAVNDRKKLDEMTFHEMRSSLVRHLKSVEAQTGLKIASGADAIRLEDNDECADRTKNDCSFSAECVNNVGSFECRCKRGYEDVGEKEYPGRRCEFRGVSEPVPIPGDGSMNMTWMIAALVLGGLILVTLFVVVVLCVKKGRGKNEPPRPIAVTEGKVNPVMEAEKNSSENVYDSI